MSEKGFLFGRKIKEELEKYFARVENCPHNYSPNRLEDENPFCEKCRAYITYKKRENEDENKS